MRNIKYLFLFGLFFLLSFMVVKANLLNLTSQTPLAIYEDSDYSAASWHRGEQSVFDANLNKWFIGIHTSAGTYYVSRWDYNFTNKEYGWSQVGTATKVNIGSKMIDYNTTDIVVYYFDNTGKTLNRSFINKKDLTITNDQFLGTKFTALGDMMGIGVASDLTVAYLNQSISKQKLYFVDNAGLNKTALCPICDVGNVTDLDLVAIPEYSEYWLFARVGSVGIVNGTCAKAVVSRYYYNSANDRYETKGLFDYATISGYCVLDVGSHQVGGTSPIYPVEGSMDVKRIGNFIYVVTREVKNNTKDWNNTVWLYAIDIANYYNTNNIVRTEEVHDLEDYDTVLNETLGATGLGLGYNSIQQAFVLFYHRFLSTIQRAQTSIGFHDYSLSSIFSCGCSVWANVSDCGYYVSGYQKQVRVCAPEHCTDETQFIDCVPTTPEIYYERVPFCTALCNPANSYTSHGGYLYPQEVSTVNCNPTPVVIPVGAVNISSTATMTVVAKIINSALTPNETYKIGICNPMTTKNCVNASFNCKDNSTLSYSLDYDGYNAGASASASFTLSGVNKCQGLFGWYAYMVSADLCVYYDKLCGGYKCSAANNINYEDYYDTECQYVNSTPCNSNHCDSTTGRCKALTTSAEELTKCTGDPFTCIFSMTGKVFSTSILMLFAIVITGGTSIYGTVATKKWQIGIVVGMAIALFFLGIGWLPSWIVILWILSVAILFMKAVFFKGD